jgi:hypothetical protein
VHIFWRTKSASFLGSLHGNARLVVFESSHDQKVIGASLANRAPCPKFMTHFAVGSCAIQLCICVHSHLGISDVSPPLTLGTTYPGTRAAHRRRDESRAQPNLVQGFWGRGSSRGGLPLGARVFHPQRIPAECLRCRLRLGILCLRQTRGENIIGYGKTMGGKN